ncbi:MAG: HD family hydrolase [Candidatus Thorarchaeota archaeon]
MSASREIVDLARKGETLKRLTRTGWALAGVDCVRPESVGEHTFGTALISSLIAKRCIDNGIHVDLGKVSMMAIIHDLVESRLSDIPRTAIELGAERFQEGKDEAEKKAIQQISEKSIHFGKWLIDLWNESLRMESMESRIVRGADIIDMIVHALSLEASGVSPKILDQFFVNSRSILEGIDLEIMEELFWDLYEEHISNAQHQGLELNRITR